MSEHPPTARQNDPDRAAGSLVPDAQGEFVADEPGGAFDPRSFADDRPPDGLSGAAADVPPEQPARGPAKPPMDDERMSGPGAEIDKAG